MVYPLLLQVTQMHVDIHSITTLTLWRHPILYTIRVHRWLCSQAGLRGLVIPNCVKPINVHPYWLIAAQNITVHHHRKLSTKVRIDQIDIYDLNFFLSALLHWQSYILSSRPTSLPLVSCTPIHRRISSLHYHLGSFNDLAVTALYISTHFLNIRTPQISWKNSVFIL